MRKMGLESHMHVECEAVTLQRCSEPVLVGRELPWGDQSRQRWTLDHQKDEDEGDRHGRYASSMFIYTDNAQSCTGPDASGNDSEC